MATHTSSREDLFPVGTPVAVYTDRGHGPPTSGAPAGTGITGSPFTVAGDGTLTVTGLETAGKYLLYAASPDRYLRIFVPGPPTFKDMDLTGVEDGDALGYDAGTNKITSLGPVVSRAEANTQTGDYTLVLSDVDKAVEINHAAPKTVSIPAQDDVAWPAGAQVLIRQLGAGEVSIDGEAGVSVLGRGNAFTTAGQYAEAVVTRRAVDVWVASGDLLP